MKRLLLIILIVQTIVSCKKEELVIPIQIESQQINQSYPTVPAVNKEMYSEINWNNVVQGKNNLYDFDNDNVPDLISTKLNHNSSSPPILYIKNYINRTILTFDIKEYNKSIRDSLNQLSYDFDDLNNDGKLDIALTYSAEWWSNGKQISKGLNSYILFNKGGMRFDVIEIIDDPNRNDPGVNLFDWDFDGKIDLLPASMQSGIYYKNMGYNKFERKQLKPMFTSNMFVNDVDFNNDGKRDFANFWINQKDEFGNWHDKDFSQTLTIVTSDGYKNYSVVGKIITKYIFMSPDIISAERINLIDGDGDGDKDLVIGSLVMDGHKQSFLQEYFENVNNEFQHRKDFIEIDKNLIGELQVWASDIDKDGDIDLYYPTYYGSKLKQEKGFYFWWENTKNGFKINKNFKLIY